MLTKGEKGGRNGLYVGETFVCCVLGIQDAVIAKLGAQTSLTGEDVEKAIVAVKAENAETRAKKARAGGRQAGG